ADPHAMADWWRSIDRWREKHCLNFKNSKTTIKPQHAIDRLYELTKTRDTYITTEVGQHQMWAAQRYHFEEPNRLMTSGGLGTMGYGLPAALGVQIAHPDSLVIDIAGEGSVQMTMQEIVTATQYNLPIKIFILNNSYLGMVRQWQQLMHGERYSHSSNEVQPDFVKLAEAMGATGMRVDKPEDLDAAIEKMIAVKGPVILDVHVDKFENCYPMIPSGAAHNEMILSDADEEATEVSDEGKILV
ncbi:MAG: thiamine pyrophosphate-dependent enzyme, partial [Rhizomicrobium sp.]